MLGWRLQVEVSPTLYMGGGKISFVRHVNDLLMNYSIPLAMFAAVRTFADGVNAEFTVIPRPFTIRFFGKD